jgi:hypothetical protein
MSIEYSAGECLVCFILGFGCFLAGTFFHFLVCVEFCEPSVTFFFVLRPAQKAKSNKTNNQVHASAIVQYMCIHALFF